MTALNVMVPRDPQDWSTLRQDRSQAALAAKVEATAECRRTTDWAFARAAMLGVRPAPLAS